MNSLTRYIKQPRNIGKSMLYHFGAKFPDAIYIKLMYYFQTGKKLDMKHPKTFNEKLQWLKLHDRKPEYSTMVDKYAAKDYVANIIGKEYIIPTLGVWDRPEDIAWDDLPNQFVLKTTHGGGSKGVVICRDKEKVDKAETTRHLQAAMKHDFYKNFREWPYKDVKHRVIAEVLLNENGNDNENEKPNENGIKDYKFFCFNGTPVYCDVISGRSQNMTSDHFDMQWTHLPFTFKGLPSAESIPAKPKNFETMRQLATRLSAGHPHLRVDFYEVNGKVYFGELTFYSASGYGQFTPEEWNETWGKQIRLNG